METKLKELNSSNLTMNRYMKMAGRTANLDVEKVLERINENPHFLMILNCALGLTGEAGEVADAVKKYIFHGHPINLDHLSKETGDITWYAAVLSNFIHGEGFGGVGMDNIEKLKKRYPDGFSEADSLERRDVNEVESLKDTMDMKCIVCWEEIQPGQEEATPGGWMHTGGVCGFQGVMPLCSKCMGGPTEFVCNGCELGVDDDTSE